MYTTFAASRIQAAMTTLIANARRRNGQPSKTSSIRSCKGIDAHTPPVLPLSGAVPAGADPDPDAQPSVPGSAPPPLPDPIQVERRRCVGLLLASPVVTA